MRFALALVVFASLSHPAISAPIDALTKAEEKAYEAWGKLGLTERTFTFVTEPSQGYGIYQEKQTSIFKPGEKVITYVEPIGYGWKELPHDMYELNFVSDVKIKAANGDVVLDQKGFAKNVLQSHNANMEFSMDFTLTLTGAPAGKYTLTYTIHDMSGDQKSSFEQDFTIAAD
ncbi:DUF3324 domain-containing protein [Rhizobium sp. XQZ8]|uniref:DUF3324 domain-containing protein n=1 Tax=Rhizobium populisoli TaxID=2859785 RepID=UPI001CA5654C|nr:DUF3324 domain-containing protein [Rhizobium populisoli]MBW6426104.1 DUF3324 domain-containing protein [Rhizobium populisoli]